jgi:4-amino-4-deoxy-L-arabinose transferase-like glycosyltransferase
MILGCPAVLGLRGIRASGQLATPTGAGGSRRLPLSVRVVIGILGFAFLFPFLIQTLLPNSDWDSAVYHLPLAERFLRGGFWETDPIFQAYNFPGAVNLYYSLLLSLGGEAAIAPLNFLAALGLMVTVYATADRIWGRSAAVWAILIAVTTNIIWELGVDARIDGLLAYFFLLAVYAALCWLKEERDSWLIYCGGMLGLCVGAKYHGLVLCGVLGLLVLVRTLWIARRSSSRVLRHLLVGAGLIVLPSSLWYLRNSVQLGNPAYPLIRGRSVIDKNGDLKPFGPEFAVFKERMSADPTTQAEVDRMTAFSSARANKPPSLFDPWNVIADPERLSRKDFHWLNPLLFLFVLLPLFARDRIGVGLFVLIVGLYAVFGRFSYLLRYLLPVLPLMAIGAGVVLASVRPRRLRIACGGAAALCIAWCAQANFRAEWGKAVSDLDAAVYLGGRVDRLGWIGRVGYVGVVDWPRMVGEINNRVERGDLEADAVLLMVGEGRGHLLKCDYLPDASQYAFRWLAELIRADGDLDVLARSLRARGVDYVVANRGMLNWALKEIPTHRQTIALGFAFLDRFISENTEVILQPSEWLVLAKINDTSRSEGNVP